MIFLIVGLPTLRKKMFKFLTLRFISAPGNSTKNLFLYGHKKWNIILIFLKLFVELFSMFMPIFT